MPTLVEPSLRFSLADRGRYQNIKRTIGEPENTKYGDGCHSLRKRLRHREEQVDVQGFMELGDLDARDVHGM